MALTAYSRMSGSGTLVLPSEASHVYQNLGAVARDDTEMVTEHALLSIDPRRAEEFEASFEKAKEVIAAADGFAGLRLLRGIESPGSYLLLVEWRDLESHVTGFRGSPAFGEWRALVGPYFAGDPSVEHFEGRASRPVSG